MVNIHGQLNRIYIQPRQQTLVRGYLGEMASGHAWEGLCLLRWEDPHYRQHSLGKWPGLCEKEEAGCKQAVTTHCLWSVMQ